MLQWFVLALLSGGANQEATKVKNRVEEAWNDPNKLLAFSPFLARGENRSYELRALSLTLQNRSNGKPRVVTPLWIKTCGW